MCVFLLPILWYQYNDKSIPKIQWTATLPGLKYPYIYYIILDSLVWSTNVISWVIGVKYTTTVRASLFANTHPLMLVIVLYLTGHPVHALEWIGVVIITIGIMYSFSDQLGFTTVATPANQVVVPSTLFGDSLCLISAFTDMLLVLIRTKTTSIMTTMQYTGYTSIGIVVVATIVSVLFEKSTITHAPVRVLCLDDDCIFGWMNQHWIALMLVFGLTVGVICIAGFNYVVKHLPPLVFSAAALLDPALTGIISYVFGIEGIPNAPTIIGGAIIVFGVYTISSVDNNRAADAVEQDGDDNSLPKPRTNSNVGVAGGGGPVPVIECSPSVELTRLLAQETTHSHSFVDYGSSSAAAAV